MNHGDQNFDPPFSSDHDSGWKLGGAFEGFSLPRSNTTYTPNQFFDVCLPHYSRGVVRLVAYMIRKTLGWCDRDGNPQDEEILVSYQDLVENAGISRGAIREAIREAIKGKFIACVREGRPSAASVSSVTALYALRWSGSPEYLRDPKKFNGFYEAEGHRTDIPNDFFDYLLPRESLAVTKVVGSIIRFSIGFQARRGSRRQEAVLSYRAIQEYAKIKNPTTLSEAIQTAIENRYIVRIRAGRFDPRAAAASTAASYAIRWADSGRYDPTGSKNVAEENSADRFKKRSETGSKNVAEDRFKKRSKEIKHINKTSKQQQSDHQHQPAPELDFAVAARIGVFKELGEVGFDEKTAEQLVSAYPSQQIANQIRWLPLRGAKQNPLGMLRRAIEENWPEPKAATEVETSQSQPSDGVVFARHFFAGLGGNSDEPTAEPSSKEVGTAERYAKRLIDLWPDQQQVPKWGRAFGQLTKTKPGPGGRPVASLVLALRLFGDEFFTQQAQVRRKALVEARKKAWQEHADRFKSRWVEYLRETEARWRTERSDYYGIFTEHQRQEREKISRSQYKGLADPTLKYFDSDNGRLRQFQMYFANEVLDFAQWDQQLNPDRFAGWLDAS